MGMIFHKKLRTEDASAFYDKVVVIWQNKWTSSLVLGMLLFGFTYSFYSLLFFANAK